MRRGGKTNLSRAAVKELIARMSVRKPTENTMPARNVTITEPDGELKQDTRTQRSQPDRHEQNNQVNRL